MIAARDLEATVARLRTELGLGEPFNDPAVGYFGLRNAVFALGDTFLEVVSPVRSDAAAARLLGRRGGDCGYMVMVQIDDLGGARRRAEALGVRTVFEVSLPDIGEVHLHPADLRGAIMSLSEPNPAESWRWGGPDWEQRAVPDMRLAGVTISVDDPEQVGSRWREIIGGDPHGLRFTADLNEPGLVEIALAAGDGPRAPLEIGGVRLAFSR